MDIQIPQKSQNICRRLFNGYQFSESDLGEPELEEYYDILEKHFVWFEEHLRLCGFTLQRDADVLFLEKDDKDLSNEEKQAIVILFLLVDLWMEKGKVYRNLFYQRIVWDEFDWFRDGYGKDYLLQVKIEEKDAIEDVLRRLSGKGVVNYSSDTRTVTLRNPAERIIKIARKVHNQLQTERVPNERVQ